MVTDLDPVVAAATAEARRRAVISHHDRTPALAHYVDALPETCHTWRLQPLAWLPGGADQPPILVRQEDGTTAVLKIAFPGDQDTAAAVMSAADGHGYARVLRWHGPSGAMLMERLGTDLWATEPTMDGQVTVLVSLLRQAWTVPLPVGSPYVGKARGLLRILGDLGLRYGTGHSAAVDRATRYASYLEETERPEVVCHGDPHAGNALRRGDGWALIDPDGFVGERAYDCGVVLRDGCHEIEAAEAREPGSGRRLVKHACDRAASLAGVPGGRVWFWAYVERVTTGLYLHRLGHADEGERFLRVATTLADEPWGCAAEG